MHLLWHFLKFGKRLEENTDYNRGRSSHSYEDGTIKTTCSKLTLI